MLAGDDTRALEPGPVEDACNGSTVSPEGDIETMGTSFPER